MNMARILMLAMAVWLAGCSQQLFGNLSEHEVNDVVGALRMEGIDAKKSQSGDETWSVSVPSVEFARSVAILRNQNLPPQNFDGLGQVFKKDSLVSTETEERARLIYALAQELQRTLSQVDGVILARVHPVIKAREAFSSEARISSAAVFIKYRASVDMASKVPVIRELVAHGIEDLDETKVSVAIFPAEARIVPGVEEKKNDSLLVMSAAGGGAALLLLLLITALYKARAKLAETFGRVKLILSQDGSRPPLQ